MEVVRVVILIVIVIVVVVATVDVCVFSSFRVLHVFKPFARGEKSEVQKLGTCFSCRITGG